MNRGFRLMQTAGGGAPRISGTHKPYARRPTVAGQPEGLLFRLDGGGQAAPAVNRPPADGAGPAGRKAPSCAVLGATGRARFARPAWTAGRPSLAPGGACPHALASALPVVAWGGAFAPSALGHPLHGVMIGCRAVGFAAHPLPPLPRFARSGIGRPDGLPLSSSCDLFALLTGLGFGPIFSCVVCRLCRHPPPEKIDGPHHHEGGGRAPSLWAVSQAPRGKPPARHRALGRPDDPRRTLCVLWLVCRRLPPRQAVRPGGRSVLSGDGKTARGFRPASLRLPVVNPLTFALPHARSCWSVASDTPASPARLPSGEP